MAREVYLVLPRACEQVLELIMYRIQWMTDTIRPDVKIGDVYEVVVGGVECRNGLTHRMGEQLIVCEKTNDTPYDEVGPYGYNWYVQSKYDKTVWATLESCIERKLLKKIN